ncbi:MAG: hypothetical protein ACXQTK_02580, partial [Candidatus Syntropharchaeales archaeon]
AAATPVKTAPSDTNSKTAMNNFLPCFMINPPFMINSYCVWGGKIKVIYIAIEIIWMNNTSGIPINPHQIGGFI